METKDSRIEDSDYYRCACGCDQEGIWEAKDLPDYERVKKKNPGIHPDSRWRMDCWLQYTDDLL